MKTDIGLFLVDVSLLVALARLSAFSVLNKLVLYASRLYKLNPFM